MHFIKPLIVVNLMQRPTFQDKARLEKKMILVQVAVTKVNYKSMILKKTLIHCYVRLSKIQSQRRLEREFAVMVLR